MHTARTLNTSHRWNTSPVQKPIRPGLGDSDASDPGIPVQDVRSADIGTGGRKLTHTARSIGRRTELELAGRDRAYSQVDPIAVIWQQFDRWL